jgi:glucose/arabinose dehydrogenase
MTPDGTSSPRCSPAACATRSASTGIRETRSCGSPTTAATGWATTRPRTNSTACAAPGLHFGYPYCHGGTLADPEFGGSDCAEFAPPAQNLGAHVAALGMRFYTGTISRRNTATHLHRRARLVEPRRRPATASPWPRLEGDRVVAYEPFATGWLQGESAWGRPADLLVLPDGSLLVSDDHAGAIYRITHAKP